MLQAAEATAWSQEDKILSFTISRASKILEDLQKVINVKLITKGRGSDGVRRSAWLMNKAKIVALSDNLREARETLWVAISASLL